METLSQFYQLKHVNIQAPFACKEVFQDLANFIKSSPNLETLHVSYILPNVWKNWIDLNSSLIEVYADDEGYLFRQVDSLFQRKREQAQAALEEGEYQMSEEVTNKVLTSFVKSLLESRTLTSVQFDDFEWP